MTYTKDAYRGIYNPVNPQKYVGDITKIVYRSSYELRFMKWCDLNRNVLQWGSEEVVIPYVSPVDNKTHRYFVDFFIKVKNREGEIKKYLIEVKPFKYTQEPLPPKRKTKQFISEVMQWGVNTAKWNAARKVAKSMGWEFMLITEKDLGLLQK
jgi:ABC-type phosphate transport system substrate-binding protein